MNIIKLVKDQLDDNFTAAAAGTTGLGADQTRKSVDAAVPAILAALLGSGSSTTGKNALGEALRSQDPGILSNLSSLVGGGRQQSLIGSGTQMLSSVLGDSKLTGLSSALGSFAGIGQGAGKSLLGMVAPVVMGVLGREQRSRNLGVDGVMDMLQSQKSQIESALPQGLADSLRATGLLGGVERARPATTETIRTTGATAARRTPPAARAPESHRGRNWGLIAAGIAALAAIIWGVTRDREPDTEPVRQAARPAAESPESAAAAGMVVGNVDVGREFSAIADELSETMRGVSNEATAEAALPRLSQLNEQLDTLAPLVDRLPGSAKPMFTDMAKEKVDDLQTQVERIESMTDVPDTVKQTVATVQSKLEDLAA